MSILIKGMEMPNSCAECRLTDLHNCFALKENSKIINESRRKQLCPLVNVPTPHGNLIDKHKLYKKTAEWEAQALEQVRNLSSEEDHDEWLKWSAALNERTAFKFDVYDAETIVEKEDDHV